MSYSVSGSPERQSVTPNESERELLRERHYAGVESAMAGTVGVAILLTLTFWTQSNTAGLLTWAACLSAATIFPLALKYKKEDISFHRWLQIACGVEVLMGILWGGITIVAMPSEGVSQAVLVAILVGVLLAGSVSSSQFTAAYVCFTLPLVGTTLLGLAMYGAEGIGAMVGFVLISWLFGASLARDQRMLLLELIGTAQNNEVLVSNLEDGHRELTQTNAKLEKAKGRADSMARTDPLTGLDNRLAFDEHIQMSLAAMAAGELQNVTLAFFDLDRFKAVNDRFGHRAGDELLVAIATRLQSQMQSNERCARIGGDELVLLATNGDDDDVGCRLLDLFQDPVVLQGTTIDVSASIGVATATTAVNKDDLMSRADAAQYTAKYAGGGRFVLWSEDSLHPVPEEHDDDRQWRSETQTQEERQRVPVD